VFRTALTGKSKERQQVAEAPTPPHSRPRFQSSQHAEVVKSLLAFSSHLATLLRCRLSRSTRLSPCGADRHLRIIYALGVEALERLNASSVFSKANRSIRASSVESKSPHPGESRWARSCFYFLCLLPNPCSSHPRFLVVSNRNQ
jgi:hypothetical protein